MSQNKELKQMGLIEKQIEAMLFVSPEPVTVREIAEFLSLAPARVDEAIKIISSELKKNHGITLIKISGGWQMVSSSDYAETVEAFASVISSQKVRLSKAALETLSVIAYNQPVTRSEIEEIRSVRCDRVVDTLLKHGLVRIAGRKKSVGSPLLFRTTDRFLEIFGLNSISSLPTLDELKDTKITPDEVLKDTFPEVAE